MKPKNYWTKENCAIEALKYNKKCDFQKKSASPYGIASKNDWLDEICQHMISNTHWSKEKCQEEALKYKTKSEFKKESESAYNRSCVNKWINDICIHMKPIGSLKKRCIYVAEFNDNHIYIGLTYSIENRISRHLIDKNSSVFKHIEKSGLTPNFKCITDYVEVNEAIIKEEYYVNYYKENNWFILNKSKTGTIGGNILKWNKEKCVEEALKHKTKLEYFKNSNGSYQSARKNGWLNDICQHMVGKWKTWNFDKCKLDALKYKTKNEYQINSRTSYDYSRKKGWLNEICKHMPDNKK